jgi:hypothetical protein
MTCSNNLLTQKCLNKIRELTPNHDSILIFKFIITFQYASIEIVFTKLQQVFQEKNGLGTFADWFAGLGKLFTGAQGSACPPCCII